MTPERAQQLADEIPLSWDDEKTAAAFVADAILAACAEERRAALTEAAEAFRKLLLTELTGDDGYACGCRDSAAVCERLRDKP